MIVDELTELAAKYHRDKINTTLNYPLEYTSGRDGRIQTRFFNYFPEAHYRQAINQALQEEVEDTLIPDGGQYTETLYAWYDPDTNTYLTHAEAGEEFASPFFEDEETARRYLDHRDQEIDDANQFEGLTLQKLKAKKIGEAVEVLTDQAGIQDFVPDGGTQQIENPQQEKVWFWYDPAADIVLQEEVEPYEVVGLFETEDDADRFIQEYGRQYDLEDLSHLEKYSAELNYEGQGPILEEDEVRNSRANELDQVDFDRFLS